MSIKHSNKFKIFLSSCRRRGWLNAIKLWLFDKWFEWKFRLDTDDRLYNKQMELEAISPENFGYAPTSYWVLAQIFRKLFEIKSSEEIILADYGFGRGRILIFALYKKVRKISGCEISQGLFEDGYNNLLRYKQRFEETDLLLFRGCATEFVPHDETDVLFFFNPFSERIFELSLTNFLNRCHQRKFFVVYINPIFDQLLVDKGLTRICSVVSGDYVECIIYEKQ